MKFKPQNTIPILLIAVSVLSLFWWIGKNPVKGFSPSVPGMDNRGEGVAVNLDIDIGEFFERLAEEESELKETWPRFRGENFDNIYRSDIELIDDFGPEGPEIEWEVKLGEGHAAPSIYEGKVYLLDYDEEEKADMLRCFSLETGTELWRRWYNVHIKRNHGMSRTIPAITRDYIVTIGPRSHVMCLDREDGDLRWSLNVEAEYGTEIPFWYTGQCPLIDDGNAIIATGGKALMVAIDCETGEKLWETPNEYGWRMSHSSIIPYTLDGVKMYVYSAVGGAFGVAAEGPDAGKILWQTNQWNHQVVAPSPVCLPDGRVFLTAGYGAGSMVLQLTKQGDVFEAQILNEYKPSEGLSSEQQTPVVFNDHFFGIQPKDAGALRNQMVCVHPDDFTDVIWSSGKTVRFGLGPYIIANNKFYILSDDGTLTIALPSTDKYIELDNYKIMDGHDAWGPLAIADGYLLLRDAKNMLCLDIAKNRN